VNPLTLTGCEDVYEFDREFHAVLREWPGHVIESNYNAATGRVEITLSGKRHMRIESLDDLRAIVATDRYWVDELRRRHGG
jgi:hypothetical protein